MYAHTALALIFATLPLIAQEGGKAPSLLTDGHRVFAQFEGTWDSVVTMRVPGSDKPVEMKGTERTARVCGGLWLRSVVQGTFMSRPFEGLAVLGYDPRTKKYSGIWIDSQSPTPARSEGAYDSDTKVLELKKTAGEGPTRSVFTWVDADRSIEIGYGEGADGKEVEVMRIERTRAATRSPTGGTTTPATGGPSTVSVPAVAAEPSHPIAAILSRLAGSWTCRMEMPDGAVVPAKEQVSAICNGTWFWSDFTTDAPVAFEGHALWGYDVRMNQFVSFWVDSSSTGLTELTGHLDEKTEVLTLHGHSIDQAGEKQRLHETIAWPTEHQRVLTMDFSTGQKNLRMTLTYERVQSTGGFHIRK